MMRMKSILKFIQRYGAMRIESIFKLFRASGGDAFSFALSMELWLFWDGRSCGFARGTLFW